MIKRYSGLLLLAAVCSSTALADATFRQVMEFKLNMPLPGGVGAPGASPFSGPTEIVARVKGGRAYSSFGKIASISDSGADKMILLDTAGKKYATTSMADYIAQVSQAASPAGQQIPEAARQILQNIQVKVESHSTGRSEKIQGIDAEETEVLFTMTIPVPIPGGNGNGMEFIGKFQVWKPKPGEIDRVPALREISAYYDQSQKTGRDTLSVMTNMFGSMPGMGEKMGDLVAALKKGGSVNLRLHGEVSMPGMAAIMQQAKASGANVPSIPDGPLFEFNSNLLELNTDSVPESVFQVPEGYQEAPVAEIIKGFVPGK